MRSPRAGAGTLSGVVGARDRGRAAARTATSKNPSRFAPASRSSAQTSDGQAKPEEGGRRQQQSPSAAGAARAPRGPASRARVPPPRARSERQQAPKAAVVGYRDEEGAAAGVETRAAAGRGPPGVPRLARSPAAAPGSPPPRPRRGPSGRGRRAGGAAQPVERAGCRRKPRARPRRDAEHDQAPRAARAARARGGRAPTRGPADGGKLARSGCSIRSGERRRVAVAPARVVQRGRLADPLAARRAPAPGARAAGSGAGRGPAGRPPPRRAGR